MSGDDANTICLGLGLRSFRPELSASQWAARVLLQPSFDPPVCISVRCDDGGRCSAEVRVPRDSLWPGQAPQRVATETAMLDESVGRWLVERLEEPTPAEHERAMFIDGMSFAAVLCRASGSRDVTGHASDARFAWIADFVKALHNALTDLHSLRGLAAAGAYVDLDLPMPDLVEEQPAVRVGVLGEPAERAELLAAMEAVRARRQEPK